MAAVLDDILDHAGLVVHRHHADQQSRCGQRLPQRFGVEQPVRADRQDDRLEALGGQVGDRFQHAFVFGRDGDDAAARIAHAERRSARRP